MKKFNINGFKIKYQLIWVPIVINIIVILFFNANIYSKTIDVVLNKEAKVPVGEITKDTIVEQLFISPSDKIDTIGIQFATYGRKNDSTLYVKLYDVDNDFVLFTWHLVASDMKDNSYIYLKVPHNIGLVKNHKYKLVFGSDNAVAGNAVTVWASESDTYTLGDLTINDSNFFGDLVIKFHTLEKPSKVLILLYSSFSFLVILFFAGFTVYYISKESRSKRIGDNRNGA